MDELLGRRLPYTTHFDKLTEDFCLFPAVIEHNTVIHCMRCNTKTKKELAMLPTGAFYCPSCIEMGRLDTRLQLIHQAEPPVKKRPVRMEWHGKLTSAQKEISEDLCQSIEKKRPHLIWAVTGAGKTEMLFAGIHKALQEGQRVALVSPRVDVCLELYPRLQAVFPEEKIALLYGENQTAYSYASLVICTTHQLLRFYQAFDFLIVDEVDSFPFQGDPKLHFAVSQSIKKKSCLTYLTATPPQKLLKDIQKTFFISQLPARFHRRKLPEPELIWWNQWYKRCQTGKKLKKLLLVIHQLIADNDVLLFCPSISLMKKLFLHLKKERPDLLIERVHASDKRRKEKVEEMRNHQFRLFLCTTILERGVTFEHVSVIVLGANHPVFTKSTLVQIAGRVDRKGDYNFGKVYLIYDEQTSEMKFARKEIKQNNQLAMRRGLIDEL